MFISTSQVIGWEDWLVFCVLCISSLLLFGCQ